MKATPQQRAIRNYRKRLANEGMARFEVLGLKSDKDFIRSIARRLAENGPEAERIREVLAPKPPSDIEERGGIYRALRRSPLVGVDLKIKRSAADDRRIEL